MKKTILFFVVFLGVLAGNCFGESKAEKNPCEEMKTAVDIRNCAYKKYEKADAKLNAVYKELQTHLTADAKKRLKELPPPPEPEPNSTDATSMGRPRPASRSWTVTAKRSKASR